jgi:ribosomal-protein-serine acetyltransferase
MPGIGQLRGDETMLNHTLSDEADLRLLEEQHAEEFFALTQRNYERLSMWVPWLSNVDSLEHTRSFIKRKLQRLADNNGFAAGIWYRGSLAGEIGLDYIDWPNRLTEIGYWLDADVEGKGLVTKACRIFIAYAFDDLDLNRVQIRCAAGNLRSRAIPEKLGFTQEGVLRRMERLHDRYVDLVIYGMLENEWRAGDGKSA